MTVNTNYNPNDHKAQRFTMRLALVTIAMSFGGLTSYYLVRQSSGNWMEFPIPSIFWVSTLILALSSMAIQMAHMANKKNNIGILKLGVTLTLVLGITFLALQWLGWQQLMDMGVFLSGGNASGSIFYVITGAHFVHVIGGLLFILLALIRTMYLFDVNNVNNTFLDKVNDKLRIRTDLLVVYWHFMGILWLYLFIFLNVNH